MHNNMPIFPHLQNQRRTINIVKLLIIEAGTFTPQYHRPYQSVVSPSVIKRVAAHVDANNSVEPGILSNMISDIMFPSVAPERDAAGNARIVTIANSWDTARYRFIMEVQIDDGMCVKTELVQGYSTNLDHTLQGSINPDLEFYVNSVATLRKTQYPTPVGRQTGIVVSGASHVLANQIYGGIDRSGFRGDNLFHMRPTDMYSHMAVSHVAEDLDINTTGMQTDTAELSDRRNNIPTVFASRVFDGLRKATSVNSLQMNDEHMGSAENAMLKQAKQYIQEPVAIDVTFLSAMSQLRNVASTNIFSLKDLEKVDPNVSRVTTHAMVAPAERMALPHSGDSEYWHGQDSTTHVASILGSVVPSIMVECGLTSFAFMVTNRTIDGSISFVPAQAPRGFVEGVDISRPMEVFKIHLINRCLNSIAMNGQRDFQINVVANLTGNSRFEIMLDGSNVAVPYNQPSFCDGLMVPTVSQYAKTGHDLARDLYHLANEAILPKDPSAGLAVTDFGF